MKNYATIFTEIDPETNDKKRYSVVHYSLNNSFGYSKEDCLRIVERNGGNIIYCGKYRFDYDVILKAIRSKTNPGSALEWLNDNIDTVVEIQDENHSKVLTEILNEYKNTIGGHTK